MKNIFRGINLDKIKTVIGSIWFLIVRRPLYQTAPETTVRVDNGWPLQVLSTCAPRHRLVTDISYFWEFSNIFTCLDDFLVQSWRQLKEKQLYLYNEFVILWEEIPNRIEGRGVADGDVIRLKTLGPSSISVSRPFLAVPSGFNEGWPGSKLYPQRNVRDIGNTEASIPQRGAKPASLPV